MNIHIEYCGEWNYKPRALSLREELKSKFDIFRFEMIESVGGVFEVKLNDQLIFSKKNLNRFPKDNEIIEIIEGMDQ